MEESAPAFFLPHPHHGFFGRNTLHPSPLEGEAGGFNYQSDDGGEAKTIPPFHFIIPTFTISLYPPFSYSTITFIHFSFKTKIFMRKTFLVIMIAGVLAACNNDTKVAGASDAKDVKPAPPMAYTATYSSSFEMGNPEYAAMILQGSWKDWEKNTMDNMKSWIADTIVAFHSDNSTVKGADSLIARWKRSRAKLTSVLDTVHAVMPVYSTDKKENWVLVWAQEISVDEKGKNDTTNLMETWRINKDGKADLLFQFDRATRKK
jgi:hypothetical protein